MTDVAVADTGPIGFLAQIDRLALLPTFAKRILVPTSVIRELGNPNSPAEIRAVAQRPPEWLEEVPVDIKGPRRNRGEREAVDLAVSLGTVLFCDDRGGIRAARRLSIATAGTLSLLVRAHELGLDDFDTAIRDLRAKTDFWFPSQEFVDGLRRKAYGTG